LKTPEGHVVTVTKHQPFLAEMLSAEWESLESAKKTFALPLVREYDETGGKPQIIMAYSIHSLPS
jgi:chaperone required for assembly of F1-ATPase